MDKPEIMAALNEMGLSVEATFVPWSQSRNKGQKDRSLNWRIKLMKNGRAIWEGDYMAGIAHCPSYTQSMSWFISNDQASAIEYETENGKTGRFGTPKVRGESILPDTCDVVYSLVQDASAIDHPSFESWAGDYGYDTDSRNAESIYRECLKIGLALRNNTELERLQELFQDY